MSGLKGFPFFGRIELLADKLKSRWATLQYIGSGRVGLDVVNTGYYEATASDAAESGSTAQKIVAAAHGAVQGDMIKVLTSANGIVQTELHVQSVTTNEIILDGICSDSDGAEAAFGVGDTFGIFKRITPRYDNSGNIITGPIIFTKNGADQEVTEDTVDPANNVPLPVKMTGVTGDVTITAQNLDVQNTHTGANPDSVQIGNGTNIMDVNASKEAKTNDADANTKLAAIIIDVEGMTDKLPATLGQKVRASSLSAALSTEDAAKVPALGAAATAASTPVNIASDQELPIKQLVNLGTAYIAFASNQVDDTAYVELDDDIGGTAIKAVRIMQTGGEAMYLAVGDAGSEADEIMVLPSEGGEVIIPFSAIAASRLSLKAVIAGTTIASGHLYINYLG